MAAHKPLSPDARRAMLTTGPLTSRTGLVPSRGKDNTTGLSVAQKWNLTIAAVMQEVLLEPDADDKGITKFTRVVRSLVDEAMAGSTEATKVIFERLEGKPAQTIHHDGQVQLSWAELVKKAIDVSAYRVVSDEVDDSA